jgi:hypothetical protein
VSRRTMGIRVHKSPVPLGLNILAGLNSTNTISSRTLFVEYKRMDQFSLHTDVTNASYFTRSERPQDTRRRHSKKDTCKQVHYDVCRLTCSTPREISSSAVFGAGPSFLGSLNTLSIGLLGLFPLLLCLLRSSFPCLLILRLARFFSTKLLAPFLLFLGLDLREQITGRSDLVPDWQRPCLPIVRNDEELSIELREDGGGSIRPVQVISMEVTVILW